MIVYVELEFESDDVTDADVHNYLNELIANNMLDWYTNKQTTEEEKELLEGAPHQMPTLEELEARVCTCGELIEKCPDAYEHMTQGV